MLRGRQKLDVGLNPLLHLRENPDRLRLRGYSEGVTPVLLEPIDEFVWTGDLISHPIDAKKYLLLPKALEAFPETRIKIYWVVIAPSGYQDIGVQRIPG